MALIPEPIYEATPSFIRGPFRILACEEIIAEHCLDSIGDIIVLDEGQQQYNARPGFHDFGCSKTGIQIIQDTGGYGRVSTSLSELHPTTIVENWHGEDPLSTLACLCQKQDKKIRAYVFHSVRLLPMEMNVPWRGEAMATPVQWTWTHGTIMDQL